ncbi:unnamed protein product [Paramecium octaurelia]|uniref:Transmembrane protein n=1 Tax=Paramecium octaurelia TaxID=43137 RepID=A0A8S1Y101_PAROT|nr:unnamed protein product [Paramecium octaurelia]
MFDKSKKILNSLGNQTIDTCDIYGQLPNFRVLEKARYTTLVGCCMTFLIGSATLIYLITELITLIDQAEPSVVQSEKQIFNSTQFPLYNDNFTLAITIANQNSEPIEGNLKYYNITVNQCVRVRNVNYNTGSVDVTLKYELLKTSCTSLPIAPCKKEDFNHELQQNFFENTRLGVVQCLDREFLQRNPPVLQGQISGSLYQYLVIQLSVCKNSTEYQGCASKEEINKVLSAGHYSVYASDYLMQLNNPGQPYSQLINLDINSFSITTSKMLQWTYRIVETHTDDGLLLSTDRVDLNLVKQDRREYSELYNDNYLVYHYIQLDYKEIIYRRTYIKLQTILSKIGGIWQFFVMLTTIILNPLINNLMTISIANELYRFPKTQNPKHSHQKINLNNQTKDDPIFDDPLSMIGQDQLPKKEERLSKSLYESFIILLGCNKRKREMFTKVKLEILRQLDIVKIIEKLHQIDMLRLVLLNEEQNNLFDLLPKPLLQIGQEIPDNLADEFFQEMELQKSFRMINNKKLQTKLKDYYSSFSSLQQDRHKSTIDDKLLHMIDKNIVQFFEQIQISQQRNLNLSPVDPLFRSKNEESIMEPQIQKPK